MRSRPDNRRRGPGLHRPRRLPRLTGLRTVLACAALALPAAALAQGTEDAPGDNVAVDIVQARGSHNRVTDELVHVVTAAAPIDVKALASPEGRPPGNVCLDIWTRRNPREQEPDFDVCATPNRAGDGLRASVSRHGRTGTIRRVGAARAEISGGTRLELRFDPDEVGRPRAYRWSAQSSSFAQGCPDSGCADTAPERGRTVETKLGTAR